jgi:hypothetical protein
VRGIWVLIAALKVKRGWRDFSCRRVGNLL